MKAYFYPFILALAGILFASCKKSNVAYEKDFNKSYRSWLSFKASSFNSYRYTVSTSSWTGHSSETTITVEHGKVVQRSYISKGIDRATNQVAVLMEWNEDVSSLNSHSNGAVPLTLDEIYQKAKAEWLQKRGNADTYFEVKNNGMISQCGYVEHGCQDDCFRGIRISLIEKL